MKTCLTLKIIVILIVFINITSCVEDDDYNTPNVEVVDPNISANTKFTNIISRYLQAVANGNQIATIDSDENLILEGYVISSDQAGNFFEELIIQNKIDDTDTSNDPRLGLRLSVNVRGLYQTYEVGRKVFVKLDGLAIGEENGVYVIGKPNGNSINQIQEFEYKDFIIRDPKLQF